MTSLNCEPTGFNVINAHHDIHLMHSKSRGVSSHQNTYIGAPIISTNIYLLPAGSEEHEVLQTGSIHVAILPSCQFLYNSTFQVH